MDLNESVRLIAVCEKLLFCKTNIRGCLLMFSWAECAVSSRTVHNKRSMFDGRTIAGRTRNRMIRLVEARIREIISKEPANAD